MQFQLFLKPNRRLTYDMNDAQTAINLVNRLNGSKDIYRSVYNYDGVVAPHNALIDKIFIDLDPVEGKDMYPAVKEIVNYLSNENISYRVYFSGRGYHIYVLTEPILASELNSPIDAIKNFVDKILENVSDECQEFVDWKCVGDVSRVTRVPNTINLKTGLFNIPLPQENLIHLSEAEVYELAQKQQKFEFKDKKIDKKVNLEQYDTPNVKHNLRLWAFEYDDDDIIIDIDLNTLPLCVKEILESGHAGYNERYLIIVCLRDLGYSLKSTINLLEGCLDQEKFEHCVYEERQPEYLYGRQDLIFPACTTIQRQGNCITGCKGQSIYY